MIFIIIIGKYLEFNGKDAFLSLKAGKLVNTKFEDITVEAWIYLRTFPEKQERWVIAAKPGSFELSVVGPDPEDAKLLQGAPFGYSFIVYTVNPDRPKQKLPFGITFPGSIDWIDRWTHISGSFNSSSHLPGSSFQGALATGLFPLDDLVNIDSPFSIGGMGVENSFFDSFIDEVRLSNVVRYINSFEPPKGPFKADENTVALWHFDGGFGDSSGNGSILLGESIRFPVEPAGKLSTTWTKIKSQD